MDEQDYLVSRYDGAVMALPGELRACARLLTKKERAAAEEIRLRTGRYGTVLLPEGENTFTDRPLTKRDIDGVLDIVTQASAHSVRDSMCVGYITLRGGYRVGICGTAVVHQGEIGGFRTVSSLSIRISREIKGAADGVLPAIATQGRLCSTLILSPPGAGKTTLLRDVIRQISEGDAGGLMPHRVALADERSEVAAMCDGVPQMDVGRQTDVLDACPKARAAMLLLRAMNPEVLALDEITSPEDVHAVGHAANCGVRLLATAHADSLSDLRERTLYRELLELRVFKRAVLIRKDGRIRTYQVEKLEGE